MERTGIEPVTSGLQNQCTPLRRVSASASAAHHLEAHPRVVAFAKNQGLGFAIPYLHAGGGHEYIPDFLVRLDNGVTLILEAKGGRDEKAEVKEQAARRWVAAVNADGRLGEWRYVVSRDMNEIPSLLAAACSVPPE